MSDALVRSEVLVLGGGGVLGEAWMNALLAGLEEGGRFDSRGFGLYLGTSAGSIVAAALVAGIAPATWLGSASPQLLHSREIAGRSGPLRLTFEAARTAGSAIAAPLASLALPAAAPGGALLRRAALRALPAGRRSLATLGRAVERSGVGWDGRLLIAAVQRESGRRVMFGAPGHRELPVSLAVQASCAIPGVFAPVRAGSHTYVDGGVWSPTNMDAADVQRGQGVLCLNPTGSLRPTIGAVAGALGPVSRAIVAAEALALRHRGAIVTTVNPDARTSAVLGTNLMDHRRRSAVIEAGLAQGRALAAAR
jgi:NTE family protein